MISIIKTQIYSIIIIFILLFLSGYGLAERSFSQDDDKYLALQTSDEPVKKNVDVYFGMRESYGLSPELPLEKQKDYVAPLTKKFIPARWSILKRFGRYEWVDVGTWSTEPVSRALEAQSPITFRIWLSYSGSGTQSGELELNWRRNEENIARANMDFQVGSDMPPTLKEINAGLVNQTPFQPGDVFSIYIRCRVGFDGAQILFGSREHNSAVVMKCNPLSLVEISACQHTIKGLYSDVFSVSPNTMTFISKVDGIDVKSVPNIDFEVRNNVHYRSVIWENELKPGNYQIEVGISYTSADNETLVSLVQVIKIKKAPAETLLGLPPMIAWILIITISLAVLLYGGKKTKDYMDDRKWMKEMGYK